MAPAVDHPYAATANSFSSDLPVPAVLPTKLLLIVRECANMTSLSEKTILRLLKRGKLRCLSSIRQKRIPVAELQRFIREN